jgi:hypothetical protein
MKNYDATHLTVTYQNFAGGNPIIVMEGSTPFVSTKSGNQAVRLRFNNIDELHAVLTDLLIETNAIKEGM